MIMIEFQFTMNEETKLYTLEILYIDKFSSSKLLLKLKDLTVKEVRGMDIACSNAIFLRAVR